MTPFRRPLARCHLRSSWPLVLATLVASCQAQPLAGDALAAETSLLQRITAEVGEARCTATADCRTLAIGSKACGGPASWMAWSAATSDGDQLQAWAQALAQRQRLRAETEGMMSTCSVVPDPGARCDAGRCVPARTRASR
jgi:hypothetical protein